MVEALGEQQQRGGGREQEGTGGRGQSNGKWSMSGFSVDPGGAVLVAGRYTVEAVQSQVILQGTCIAGRETWLGVDLLKGGGRTKVTGWVQSGELQRRAAVTGHGLRGAVVGWYLPVLVVGEEQMRRGGARVVVLMKRVAVGRSGSGNQVQARVAQT